MLLQQLAQRIQTTNARLRNTRLPVLWFPANFIGFTHNDELITGEFIRMRLGPAGNAI
jgi:hypothetical protein